MTRNDELKAGQGLSVERVRELLDGRTPGEWKVYKYWNGRLDVHSPTGEDDTCTSVITYPTAVDVELLALAPTLGEALISSEARVEALALERDRLAHELRLLREVMAAPVGSGQVRAELIGLPERIDGDARGHSRDDDQDPHEHGHARMQRAGWKTLDEDRHAHGQPEPSQTDPQGAQQRRSGEHRDDEAAKHAPPQCDGYGLPPEFVGDVGLLEEHAAVLTRGPLSDDTPERSGGEG